MSLVIGTIQSELSKLMDASNGAFVGYPANSIAAAVNWMTAIDNYAQSVIPVSTTAAAAKTAAIAILSAPAPGAFFPALISALTTYATTLATGMAPAFTAVPPPAPISFATLLALPLNASVSARVSLIAGLIDTWFLTGSATPSGGGSPVPWS